MQASEITATAKPTVHINETTIAYLKPVETKDGKAFAVCSATGEQLAIFKTRDAAFFAAKQHDLEPVLLH
jgi:hypothetical protein